MDTNDIMRLPPKYRQQIMAQMTGNANARSHKFGAEKAVRAISGGHGYKFASKAEALRYDALKSLLAAGVIRKLKIQPQYTLQESYIDGETGERVQAIRYVADFSYERMTEPDCNGQVYWLPVVEDVKGFRTPEYQMKKKLMAERFWIHIEEVKA